MFHKEGYNEFMCKEPKIRLAFSIMATRINGFTEHYVTVLGGENTYEVIGMGYSDMMYRFPTPNYTNHKMVWAAV